MGKRRSRQENLFLFVGFWAWLKMADIIFYSILTSRPLPLTFFLPAEKEWASLKLGIKSAATLKDHSF